MEYLNPLFNEQRIIKKENRANQSKTLEGKRNKDRKVRSDKTHNLKFPVSSIEKIKLQSLCKQVQRKSEGKGTDPIRQTKLNTLLLLYGINNQHLISWDWPYKDSKYYMHTNPLETIYKREIGGPFGLAIQKGLSERKTAYMIIMSVLKWLEGEGNIEKIL
ncbi:hypothetical protein AB9M62_25615 [Bacillales bacterium AN1005]